MTTELSEIKIKEVMEGPSLSKWNYPSLDHETAVKHVGNLPVSPLVNGDYIASFFVGNFPITSPIHGPVIG